MQEGMRKRKGGAAFLMKEDKILKETKIDFFRKEEKTELGEEGGGCLA